MVRAVMSCRPRCSGWRRIGRITTRIHSSAKIWSPSTSSTNTGIQYVRTRTTGCHGLIGSGATLTTRVPTIRLPKVWPDTSTAVISYATTSVHATSQNEVPCNATASNANTGTNRMPSRTRPPRR